MFADIFANKSDNFFLDPRRYIRRHDICKIDMNMLDIIIESYGHVLGPPRFYFMFWEK